MEKKLQDHLRLHAEALHLIRNIIQVNEQRITVLEKRLVAFEKCFNFDKLIKDVQGKKDS